MLQEDTFINIKLLDENMMYESFFRAMITFILTLIISPLAYYLMSHHIYKSKEKRWPVEETDKWGDTIFLPLFNATAAYAGIFSITNTTVLAISAFLGIILTIIYNVYNKYYEELNDWSRPRKGVYNFGGWYHASYMLIQSVFLFYAIIIFYDNLLLWASIAGYALMAYLVFRSKNIE